MDTVEKPQSKTETRVLHLLEKMGEAHANYKYHEERAAYYMRVGAELNAKVVKIVHQLSDKYRIVPAPDDDKKTETEAPQNMEELIDALLGKMGGRF